MDVLVATDFSLLAAGAVEVAADYARRLGGRLHVLHVAWPDAGPDTRATVERIAHDAGGGAGVVRLGLAAAAEIVRYAEEHAVDLIVVGTHGRTGVSRVLLGSVAERVVRTAACPVLTVPRLRRLVIGEPAPEVPRAVRPSCVVCRGPADELICEGCRARIRGEALEHKFRDEKAGRRSL